MFLFYGLGDGPTLYVENDISQYILTDAERATTSVDIYEEDEDTLHVLNVQIDADLKIAFNLGQCFCQNLFFTNK